MTERLIFHIYKRLLKVEVNKLPVNFRNGRLGVCLFLIFYSSLKGNNSAGKRAQLLLLNIWNEFRDRIYSHPGECGEIVYVLRHLEENDLFHNDGKVESWFKLVDNTFQYDYFSMPIHWFKKDDIFLRGIYVLKQRKNEDSLERYTVDETLIFLIGQCELLLFSSIEYNIYQSKDITLSLLHSILYFLNETKKMSIYPYKTEKLLTYLPEIYLNIQKRPPFDDFIYHALKNDGKNVLHELIKSPEDLISFLGKAGCYSFLYNNCQIFTSAWKYIQLSYPNFQEIIDKEISSTKLIGLSGLSGIGYGLLHLNSLIRSPEG